MARTFKNPITGEDITISLKGGWDWQDGYMYNNMGRTSNPEDVELAIQYIITNGITDPTASKSAIQAFLKQNGRKAPRIEMDEIIHDASKFINDSGYDMNKISAYVATQRKEEDDAINDYINANTPSTDEDYLEQALNKIQFTSQTEQDRESR